LPSSGVSQSLDFFIIHNSEFIIPMKSDAIKIVRRLRQRGFTAYLVGGCVRDMVMGLRPKDFDVATDARPEQIQEIFRKTIPVGARFGVVIVRQRGKNYEVATFRKEHGYSDGRRPDAVAYGTAREDVRRRDFTVNGLFYDPMAKQVIDYVGGVKDIKRKMIRAIGDPEARLAEDKLRMIRAVRFANRLGFRIEHQTAAAVRNHALEIQEISAERVRDELAGILTGPAPGQGLRRLDELNLLAVVLPEVKAMQGVAQPPEFHPEGDVWTHTLLMLDKLQKPALELALAALLHDVGKPNTFAVAERIRFDRHPVVGEEIAEKILRRLRFPNETVALVTKLVREHLRFMDVPRMKESTLKRFLRLDRFDLHLALHRLDCLASHGDLSTWRFCRERQAAFAQPGAEQALRPKPLLNGHDLIELGLTPGPIFRKILTAVEDAQLEGKVKDRAQALALARELAKL